jgi:hypothetical protein
MDGKINNNTLCSFKFPTVYLLQGKNTNNNRSQLKLSEKYTTFTGTIQSITWKYIDLLEFSL